MIEKGKKVKVEYKGTLNDGSVFDKSEEPLEFEVGSGQVIEGFDEAVIDMSPGDTKTVHIDADKAYGQKDPLKIKEVPRDQLPPELDVGAVLMLSLPTGQRIPAKVSDIGKDNVTIDLNHPLAGRELTFEIRLLEVN